MGRESVPRGTPTVHAVAWDPTSNGRDWDSKTLLIVRRLPPHAPSIPPPLLRSLTQGVPPRGAG